MQEFIQIQNLELDPINKTCKIGAGCTLEQINQYLAERGFELPIEGMYDDNQQESSQ